MAEAPDTTRKANTRKTAAPKVAARKSTTAKTKAVPARKRVTKKAANQDFSESIGLARAAMASAKTVAQAKLKGASSNAKAKVKDAKESAAFDWKTHAKQVKADASKMARQAAGSAKDRTGSAMHGLADLISDTAQTVDSKLGPQYGDYARQAATAVANAAKSLDERDVDQLMTDAKDFVRKSPAVAIGAAAIAGYVLMRLARGSSSDEA